jgi:ubiquinone/menaquinone biosynthesis C-methylase UbiE
MSEITDYYNNIANIYEEDRFNNSYGAFIDSQEKIILNKLLTDSKANVLDLACGTGRLMHYAQVGVDASEQMVKIAAAKFPQKQIQLADATNTNFDNNRFDVIISFHFLMHLDKQTVAHILIEAYRILKKGGRLIFDIPSKKRRIALNYKAQNWHGAFSFTKEELLQYCNDMFIIKNHYGILFLPLHRIPKSLRKMFLTIDLFLANSFLKNYSSYLIFELEKK